MAHIEHVDEMVREYLLFRGFTSTLKAFDLEIKADKDKGFRVDRVVDSILQLVHTGDSKGLRGLWLHFEKRMFSHMEQDFMPAIKKLENGIWKLYVVHAVSNNKPDKVTEFLSQMALDLQNNSEWKEWFTLPYIKNPEDNQVFSIYFTRQWQDTLILSLHNFLSIVYQAMPQPSLSSFEEEAVLIRKLQEENSILNEKLKALTQANSFQPSPTNLQKDPKVTPEFTDEFYFPDALPGTPTRAPNTRISEPRLTDNTVKSLKNLIRNIGVGLPTSPLLSRKTKDQSSDVNVSTNTTSRGDKSILTKKNHSKSRVSGNEGVPRVSSDEGSTGPKRSISLDRENTRSRISQRDSSLENPDRRTRQTTNKKMLIPFLLLSQDSFEGHKSTITQCQFNYCGSIVASTDVDGIAKIWSPAPSPVLLGSSSLRCRTRCLDWVCKNERFLVLGSDEGLVHLYDTKEYKTVWETGNENNSPLRDAKVASITSSPTDSSFVCSTISNKNEHHLLLYDIKIRKLERTLNLDCDPSVYVTCCTHNHNGQLLHAGCSDGVVRTFDLRHSECVDQWQAHSDQILCLQLSPDHTACYSLGADNKLCRRSLNMGNQGPNWDAIISSEPLASLPGRKFALDQAGKHILLCYGQTSGATIFKITNTGLNNVLALKGHKTSAIACDWATANQCCTCITASIDGKICVSTLLIP